MRRVSAIVMVLAFPFCGCDSVAEESSTPPAAPAAAAESGAHVHDLICGCALPEVGHCGNYIKVGDEFVELAGDLGLGPMEFCHKDGLQAEVAGDLKDGKFVATSFDYVK